MCTTTQLLAPHVACAQGRGDVIRSARCARSYLPTACPFAACPLAYQLGSAPGVRAHAPSPPSRTDDCIPAGASSPTSRHAPAAPSPPPFCSSPSSCHHHAGVPALPSPAHAATAHAPIRLRLLPGKPACAHATVSAPGARPAAVLCNAAALPRRSSSVATATQLILSPHAREQIALIFDGVLFE